MTGPILTDGTAQDRASVLPHAPVPPGALRLADLGCRSLAVFRRLGEQRACWRSRLDLQTAAWVAGERADLPAWLERPGARVDAPVALGVRARLPARQLGRRVPPTVAAERRRKPRAAANREGRTPPAAKLALAGWTLLVTNVPTDRPTLGEELALARARWPIERLFKLRKHDGRLDESRSAAPHRILCEVDAKLTALVVQHWVLLAGCWGAAARSLTEAAKTVRREATCLAGALRHRGQRVGVLRTCAAAWPPVAGSIAAEGGPAPSNA